jgi:hypothetical protein
MLLSQKNDKIPIKMTDVKNGASTFPYMIKGQRERNVRME